MICIRLGPAILEQKRSRLMMKKAKVPNMKRSSMVKLKRMLADCLMEKNILEGRLGRCAENQNGNLRWHLP